jgi:hypothetical protein
MPEILTGEAPYQGAAIEQVLRWARAGDLAEAFTRLDGCGADAGLVALCRECLAAERDERPGDAGEVAARVTGYGWRLGRSLALPITEGKGIRKPL